MGRSRSLRAKSIEVRFGSSGAGSVGMALFHAVYVRTLPSARAEAYQKQLRGVGRPTLPARRIGDGGGPA
ncbi:hypothetical protein GCM10010211_73650 [Streptomyces albospinus]|uniref:Uncharacterized protein n=1 Tax=Streptomyces albospinus TaxID=285515 RepID=A0ABQ2VL69_9ACTN|nr:hypothetical protein GCM10010211_73650 [Streptomyces albospinus]